MGYQNALTQRAAKLSRHAIGVLAFAFIAIWLILDAYFIVAERERAVVARLGEYKYDVGAGLHWKVPIIDRVQTYSIAIQSQSLPALETYTNDNQPLYADLEVVYRIPVDHVETVYKEIPDFSVRLHTLVTDRFKRIMGKKNIADIAQGRAETGQEIFINTKDEAKRLFGIDIIDLQIVELHYSKSFLAAVEHNARKKAELEGAKLERAKAEVEAERKKIVAIGEANADIEQARGAAEARKLKADGEAQARKLQAEAEAQAIKWEGEARAEAIQKEADALKANPVLVDLRKAEQWNGKLPTHILGGAIPFFNLGDSNDKNSPVTGGYTGR